MPPKIYGKLALAGLTMLALIMVIGTSARAERSNPLVRLETSLGEITLELYPDKAPATVANFLQYVREGFYDGTIFHRVINGFMIQGGGSDANLNQKPTRAPIQNEADNGLTNQPYTVAMARTSDPHSATSQFFINVADNKVPQPYRQDSPGLGLRGLRPGGPGPRGGGPDQGRAHRQPGRLPERAANPGGHRQGHGGGETLNGNNSRP